MSLICGDNKQIFRWTYVRASDWRQLISAARPKIFGTTILDAAVKCNRYVPLVVENAILVIEQCMHFCFSRSYSTALTTEGLFRVPGDAVEIERFCQIIDKGLSSKYC